MSLTSAESEARELVDQMVADILSPAIATDAEIYEGLPSGIVSRLKEIESAPGMRQTLYRAAQMRKARRVVHQDRPCPSARFVYFIRAERSGLIKIGSAANPEARLTSLQTGSPEPLSIIGVRAGGECMEKALHAKFAAYRSRGEWFHPSEELLSEVGA